jgi:phosphoserine phosphatase
MDGTLSTVETWRGVHAWIRANHPSPAARRFVLTQMPFIFLARAGLYDKEAFRARWMLNHARLLRGVPEGKLAAMGEWVVEHHLWPARRVAAIQALDAAIADARAADPQTVVVLASGAYVPVAEAFAARIGAGIVIGTPLEMGAGAATGRLAGPVQTGPLKARAVRERIGEASVLVAFGDTAADIPMLELARRPVAVAPDGGLRRAALERGWELLETS